LVGFSRQLQDAAERGSDGDAGHQASHEERVSRHAIATPFWGGVGYFFFFWFCFRAFACFFANRAEGRALHTGR
jgi:hypothetical protein